MKDEDAKHELRESESGQTRAKQKKDLQRSQPETPWKLIRREWYTTFSRAPARMEGLCRCTVREFSLQGCSFGPVDVLMQHRLNPCGAPRRQSLLARRLRRVGSELRLGPAAFAVRIVSVGQENAGTKNGKQGGD